MPYAAQGNNHPICCLIKELSHEGGSGLADLIKENNPELMTEIRELSHERVQSHKGKE